MRNLITGLKSLLNKPRVDRELEEELDTYLQASTRHKQSAGLSEQEARQQALRELGSRNSIKHQVWTTRWESTADSIFQDIRISLRMLLKSPGFTLVALLSLALGIGANTAIFTLIHQVLLRNLPVQHPEQLVSFGSSISGGIDGGIDLGTIDLYTWDFTKQLEANPGPFQSVAAYSSFAPRVSVRGPGVGNSSPAAQLAASMVSANYFAAIGATPLLGRTILPSDVASVGSSAVAVIGHHYWQQELSADPDILGKSISVNGTAFRVIGVMRDGFFGIKPDIHPPDLWVPVTMDAQIFLQPDLIAKPREIYFLHMFARRKLNLMSDADLKQTQLWLNQQVRAYIRAGEGAIVSADRQAEINRTTVSLVSAAHGVNYLGRRYGDTLNVLMVVVALVLLIACANLANFLLARAASRQREIATRLALGSSRLRIIRQSLVETLLLSLLGGTLGLALAFAATRALIAFVTQGVAFTGLSPFPDLPVLLFTLAVSLATGILFGIVPAILTARSATSSSTTQSLSSSARNTTGSRATRLFPKFLVTAQVMLSLVLLIVAGLFLRTLNYLQSQDFGFERSNLLIAEYDAGIAGYTPDRMPTLNQTLVERLESIPGVRSASLSAMPPIGPGTWGSSITIPGYTPAPKEDMQAVFNRVTGRYFETTGISIVSGRAITPADSATSQRVAVINQALARRYFPKGDAIGHSLKINIDSIAGPWQIVGIARDTRDGNPRDADPRRQVYMPLSQMTGTERGANIIALRTTAEPTKTIADLRHAIAQVDPNIPIFQIRTIQQQVDTMITQEKLFSSLTTIFSTLALLLAAIGLYGVISYSVIRRTSEIGIRLALGQQTNSVLWMVLKESLILLAIGLAIGLPLTFTAIQLSAAFLQTQLFGLKALDPTTFLSAISVVTAMTVIAAWLPAKRASKTDPMQALRCD